MLPDGGIQRLGKGAQPGSRRPLQRQLIGDDAVVAGIGQAHRLAQVGGKAVKKLVLFQILPAALADDAHQRREGLDPLPRRRLDEAGPVQPEPDAVGFSLKDVDGLVLLGPRPLALRELFEQQLRVIGRVLGKRFTRKGRAVPQVAVGAEHQRHER